MGRITFLIRKRQLRFYGHVVRFRGDDSAHRILTSKDSAGWKRRHGRPRASCLSQLENFKEMVDERA